jgi:hypothetical protein
MKQNVLLKYKMRQLTVTKKKLNPAKNIWYFAASLLNYNNKKSLSFGNLDGRT